MKWVVFLLLVFTAATIADPALAQSKLTDVGCAQEGRIQSLNSATPTTITFVNQSALTFRTYWLNFHGKRVFYAEVAPGKSYVQQTYVTHPWVITNNPAGDCIGLYQPAPSPGSVVIQ